MESSRALRTKVHVKVVHFRKHSPRKYTYRPACYFALKLFKEFGSDLMVPFFVKSLDLGKTTAVLISHTENDFKSDEMLSCRPHSQDQEPEK